MMTSMNALAAGEHRADLRRQADEWRLASNFDVVSAETSTVVLSLAVHDDQGLLELLAALDDARPLPMPVLLARVDGEAVAALSLRDGRVVANPFVASEPAVALLRLRQSHLHGERSRRGWRDALRARFALS
jgi:hypothetical protein